MKLKKYDELYKHLSCSLTYSILSLILRKGEGCTTIPLASSVLAALEHTAPEKRAELQQGLLVYVAKIAVVLV